jgi:hypothetical protein
MKRASSSPDPPERIYTPTVMRALSALLALSFLLTGSAFGAHRSPIRVTLTADNHRPRPSDSPSWHWGYCVKVTTVAGRSVASAIHLRILEGHRLVREIGLIWLRKGYDRWCSSIGGEDNVLYRLPRGQTFDFQAVVRADGVTVERNWLFVVR